MHDIGVTYREHTKNHFGRCRLYCKGLSFNIMITGSSRVLSGCKEKKRDQDKEKRREETDVKRPEKPEWNGH